MCLSLVVCCINIIKWIVHNISLILWMYQCFYVGYGLWCLTPLSTIFQLYHGSQLLVEETGVPGENYRPVTDTLWHELGSTSQR